MATEEYHLWGILNPTREESHPSCFRHLHRWEYIRPCGRDRRALNGIDKRKYSQLEIRESDTGKTVMSFVGSLEDV